MIVPLMASKSLYLYGSNVEGFLLNAAYGGFVDLAVVAVQ